MLFIREYFNYIPPIRAPLYGDMNCALKRVVADEGVIDAGTVSYAWPQLLQPLANTTAYNDK